MVFVIINWVAGTMALLVLSSLFPGFRVSEFAAALIAAGVCGLLNSLLALVLRHITGVLSLAMSAAFLFLFDAFVFRVSALLVPGFAMRGFLPALAGSTVLLVLNLALVRYLRIKDEAFGSESALSS